ncbi:hypothetical protein [Streptomyces agglomeratus]|nr:hypothetical protein [Streptomyces agglomeratus]
MQYNLRHRVLGGCIGLWAADKIGLLGAILSLLPEDSTPAHRLTQAP